jgi:hypothetical protein
MKPLTLILAFIFPKLVKPVVFVGDQVRMANGPGRPISEVFLVMLVQPPLIYLRNVSRPGLQQVFVYGLNDIVRLINKGEMEVLHG